MINWYPRDPAVHSIAEIDVIKSLRRDLKTDKLVALFNEQAKVWVVALVSYDKGSLADIAFLGSGEGEGPWITGEQYTKIVGLLTNLITHAEIKKKLRRLWKKNLNKDEADQADYFDGLRKVHAMLKKRRGPKVAEEYILKSIGTTKVPKDFERIAG